MYPWKSPLLKNDKYSYIKIHCTLYIVKCPGDKAYIIISHEGDSATADTEFHLMHVSAAGEARSCNIVLGPNTCNNVVIIVISLGI